MLNGPHNYRRWLLLQNNQRGAAFFFLQTPKSNRYTKAVGDTF